MGISSQETPLDREKHAAESSGVTAWRGEHSAKTGATSQSLLWNLYRHESTPAAKKTSLLFGLYQTQMAAKGKQVRLFYLPILKAKG